MGFLLQNVYMKAQTAKERQQRGERQREEGAQAWGLGMALGVRL